MSNHYRLPSNIGRKRVYSYEALNEMLRLLSQKGLAQRFPVYSDAIICRLEFERYLAESENAVEDIFTLCDIVNELEYRGLQYEVLSSEKETSLLMYCLFLTDKNPAEPLMQDCLISTFKLNTFKLNIEANALPVIEEYLLQKVDKRKRLPEICVCENLTFKKISDQ